VKVEILECTSIKQLAVDISSTNLLIADIESSTNLLSHEFAQKIDPDTVTAKFKKKTSMLTIEARIIT